MMKRMWLGSCRRPFLISGPAQATQLITADEAKLPPPKGAIAMDRRGILRGPKWKCLAERGGPLAVAAPVEIRVLWRRDDQSDSVKVIYLRAPNVDLTPRVRPFIQADGIDMPEAELPPGEYTVRVDVKDSDGRPGTSSFTLTVSP